MGVNLEDDVTAVATIPTVGPSPRNELFTRKTAAAVSPVARPGLYGDFVDEHSWISLAQV